MWLRGKIRWSHLSMQWRPSASTATSNTRGCARVCTNTNSLRRLTQSIGCGNRQDYTIKTCSRKYVAHECPGPARTITGIPTVIFGRVRWAADQSTERRSGPVENDSITRCRTQWLKCELGIDLRGNHLANRIK